MGSFKKAYKSHPNGSKNIKGNSKCHFFMNRTPISKDFPRNLFSRIFTQFVSPFLPSSKNRYEKNPSEWEYCTL